MSTSQKSTKLAVHIRLLIGVFSLPSLILAYMIGMMALNGNYQEIDSFEWLYSLIGFLAAYIAITGKRLF